LVFVITLPDALAPAVAIQQVFDAASQKPAFKLERQNPRSQRDVPYFLYSKYEGHGVRTVYWLGGAALDGHWLYTIAAPNASILQSVVEGLVHGLQTTSVITCRQVS
jgi:hypothetical protein